MRSVLVSAFLLSVFCAVSPATTLRVSATGQFSSDVVNTPYAGPNETFSLSFYLPPNPPVTNTDTLGFDSYFLGFSYQLNGAQVPVGPVFVRFATSTNSGLFSVFLGPEGGYDSNGNPVPQFSFEGSQVFSGTTSNPTILSGTYSTAYWSYSDSLNFDSHTSPGDVVTIAVAVPEPGSSGLLSAAGLSIGLAVALRRRFRSVV